MKRLAGAFGGSDDPSGGTPGEDPARLQEAELTGAVGELGQLIAASRARLVRLVREGVGRGLHVETGFSVPDWVCLLAPGLSRRDAVEVAVVAQAGQRPVHEPLVSAVEDGRIPLARAARIVRALDRVRSAVPAEEYAQAVALLAGAAAKEGFNEKDLERVCRRLVAVCTSQRDQDENERSRHQLRDLHESSLADGSVRRFVLTVGDDTDLETIRAILMSRSPRQPAGRSRTRPERRTRGPRVSAATTRS